MRAVGDKQKETIRPDFDTSISIDFQGAKITSDTGFLVMREIDQRFNILAAAASEIDDPRSARHTDHSLLELLRQRVYQVAGGYEDCNDADHLRVDPALRLALGKEDQNGAGQSALCRFENNMLATGMELKALEKAFGRSADTLLRRRNKRRLIIDVDSTDDPVHGNQEGAAFNGYFEQVCYHPVFCLTSKGDLLNARLRPGNAHSAEGVMDPISPLVERYRSRFKSFWLRGDAAFAGPDLYEFCEKKRMTYFIRLPSNNNLKKLIQPHLNRPTGRPPKSGIQVKVIEFDYQAEKWNKPRRVVCKIEWHVGELFPRGGFIVTNSHLKAERVIKIYNGRAEIENRIKEGKDTLRWDKTGCHRFGANQARLLIGCLAYNLLHMIRDSAFLGERVKPSIESVIRRFVKVGARVVYHARRWYVHAAAAFPLARHYRILFD
jgi:hypothetical protein